MRVLLRSVMAGPVSCGRVWNGEMVDRLPVRLLPGTIIRVEKRLRMRCIIEVFDQDMFSLGHYETPSDLVDLTTLWRERGTDKQKRT